MDRSDRTSVQFDRTKVKRPNPIPLVALQSKPKSANRSLCVLALLLSLTQLTSLPDLTRCSDAPINRRPIPKRGGLNYRPLLSVLDSIDRKSRTQPIAP